MYEVIGFWIQIYLCSSNLETACGPKHVVADLTWLSSSYLANLAYSIYTGVQHYTVHPLKPSPTRLCRRMASKPGCLNELATGCDSFWQTCHDSNMD